MHNRNHPSPIFHIMWDLMVSWVGCEALDITILSYKNISALHMAHYSYTIVIFCFCFTYVSQKLSAVTYFKVCCVDCAAYLVSR
jgi:hypothetical protein